MHHTVINEHWRLLNITLLYQLQIHYTLLIQLFYRR